MVLDSSANWALMVKTFDQAVEILDCIAKNNSEWAIKVPTTHPASKSRWVAESNQIYTLNAQMQAVQMIRKEFNLCQPTESKYMVAYVCVGP